MTEPKRHGRKLLIASIGVAAVSYVACGGSTTDNAGGGGSGSNASTGGSANTGGSRNTGGSVNTAGSANTGGGNTAGSVNTGGQIIIVGNLMGFPADSGPDTSSTTKDAATEKAVFGFDVLVANLIAPPPPDAKADTK